MASHRLPGKVADTVQRKQAGELGASQELITWLCDFQQPPNTCVTQFPPSLIQKGELHSLTPDQLQKESVSHM